jgi:hypothetical protein
MTLHSEPSLRDDLLWGAEQIAHEINRSVRETYYLLQHGLIPAEKVGDIWTSTKSGLRRRFSGEQAA